MSEIEVFKNSTLEERMKYARTLASAGELIPRDLWAQPVLEDGRVGAPAPSPGKILLVMETGSMLGIHPMAALQTINVIDGRATLSVRLMSGLIRSGGHTLSTEKTGSIVGGDYSVTVSGVHALNKEEGHSTWTVERAIQAGLVSSYAYNEGGEFVVVARDQNNEPTYWERHTESMLWNRAFSELARQLFSDVLLGLYSTEEMRDSVSPAVPARKHEPVERAPKTDWGSLLDGALTVDGLEVVRQQILDANENTDALRLKYAAKKGVLVAEADVEDAEEVTDEPDAATEANNPRTTDLGESGRGARAEEPAA